MHVSRRTALQTGAAILGGSLIGGPAVRPAIAAKQVPEWEAAMKKGLNWLAGKQNRLGLWNYPSYGSVPATALAGTAMICSGSTTTQGPYASYIRKAVDYLLSKVRQNGLIGEPNDARYTYGHGFSMLFLSQVLGEEEDIERREELVEVLNKAVAFSSSAQAPSGGWGYVSTQDQPNFDEGSTTITQVQGLRGCRNAGIPVADEVIEKAKEYIYVCKNQDGGISYSSRNRGASRPAITAAALATLYNAGAYDSKHVPDMLKYCKANLHRITGEARAFGHWHYTYLYYSQVVYRQGSDEWEPFRDKLYAKIVGEQQADGSWTGNIAPEYVTSCNLIMLQLDKAYLPIYQR
jgi:squalene cyclase